MTKTIKATLITLTASVALFCIGDLYVRDLLRQMPKVRMKYIRTLTKQAKLRQLVRSRAILSILVRTAEKRKKTIIQKRRVIHIRKHRLRQRVRLRVICFIIVQTADTHIPYKLNYRRGIVMRWQLYQILVRIKVIQRILYGMRL